MSMETFELIVRVYPTRESFDNHEGYLELRRLDDIGLARLSQAGIIEILSRTAELSVERVLRTAEAKGMIKL